MIEHYKEFLKNKHIAKPLSEAELNEAGEEARKIRDEIEQYLKKPINNEYLTRIEDDCPDVDLWNRRLDEYVVEHQKQPNYYDTSILWTECFMYRTLMSAFLKSKYFKDFDVFEKIKQGGLYSSRIAATKLVEHTANIANRLKENQTTCEEEFENFLSFALWGNDESFVSDLE